MGAVFGGGNDLLDVAFRPNVESPSVPGELSCVSGPLDEHCDDVGAFFDELVELVLDPIGEKERCVLKDVLVTEHGPGDRTVKAIFDGKKLQAHGAQPGDGNVCRLFRYKVAREDLEILALDLDPADEKTVLCVHTTRVLKDPLRVETFNEEASGGRGSGADLASFATEKFLRPILHTLRTQQVPVRWGTDSPLGGGPCAISGKLDDFFGYEELFRAVLTRLKTEALAKGATVDYPSVREVEIGYGFDPEAKLRTCHSVYHDLEAGEITIDEFVDKVHGNKICYRFLKDPLRLALHTETSDDRRVAGKSEGRTLRLVIHALIDKGSGR